MKALFVIAVAAVLLAGCARRYKMTLTNGGSITTSSKPKLNNEGTAYLYKDRLGRDAWVSAGRVNEISAE
jgi:uncharacterized lipoprotein YajG